MAYGFRLFKRGLGHRPAHLTNLRLSRLRPGRTAVTQICRLSPIDVTAGQDDHCQLADEHRSMHLMSPIRRFDHVGITVRDLDTVTAFFVELGFQTEGRTVLEGDFLDTVIGMQNARTEIVMLRLPDGGTGLELSCFIRPNHEPGTPNPMHNELGLRNVTFEVDDLQTIIDRLATDGYQLVGGVGQYEGSWRMASVRGPDGIIVNLAEQVDTPGGS
jgi:catechol 2,3-dioxygenase-like lactoylglutathione lyase family enzyme